MYNDTGLIPNTNYSFFVESENDFGRARSSIVMFLTPPGIPEGLLNLIVSKVGDRSAEFSWTGPSKPNGPIDSYMLISTSPGSKNETVHWRGNELFCKLTDLIPYTNYTFMIVACTSGGCLRSDPEAIVTLEAVPQGQEPPVMTAKSSTELLVMWEPPEEPNGTRNILIEKMKNVKCFLKD